MSELLTQQELTEIARRGKCPSQCPAETIRHDYQAMLAEIARLREQLADVKARIGSTSECPVVCGYCEQKPAEAVLSILYPGIGRGAALVCGDCSVAAVEAEKKGAIIHRFRLIYQDTPAGVHQGGSPS